VRISLRVQANSPNQRIASNRSHFVVATWLSQTYLAKKRERHHRAIVAALPEADKMNLLRVN
jgi:hypothetical protein